MNVRQTCNGMTRNLGEEGALLSFDAPPDAQAMDWVEVALDMRPNPIRLFGKIVAVRGLMPGGRTEVHVQFTACERQDLARLRQGIRAEAGA